MQRSLVQHSFRYTPKRPTNRFRVEKIFTVSPAAGLISAGIKAPSILSPLDYCRQNSFHPGGPSARTINGAAIADPDLPKPLGSGP
jgi:hypothetical protein